MRSTVDDHNEREQRHLEAIAEAGVLLASALDERKVLEQLASLVVAEVGDWCAIDLVADGRVDRVVLTTADPAMQAEADVLREQPPSLDPDLPFGRALAKRTTEIIHEVSDELLRQAAQDEEQLALLRRLNIAAGLVVPMVARGSLLGAISVAWTDRGASIDRTTITFVEELARRGAVAIDNARLFGELQEAEERYRGLVEQLEALVWEVDPKTGELTYVSPSLAALLGSEMDDPRTSAALSPDGIDYRELAEQLRTGAPARIDITTTTADDDWLALSAMVSTIPGSDHLRALGSDVTERRRHETHLAIQVTAAKVLGEETDPDRIIELLLEKLLGGLGWDAAGLWVLNEDGDLVCRRFLTRPADSHQAFADISEVMTMPPGVGLPGRVLASGGPAWIEDVTVDENFPRARYADLVGLVSAFGFPIKVTGSVIGVVEMFTTARLREDPRLLAIVDSVGSRIGQQIERAPFDRSLGE